jgi:regulator of replication initiation timing
LRKAASPRQTAAATNTPTNDAIVAEVNKQRAATRAFTEQTAALNQKLGQLSQAVGQTEEIAKENLALKHDLADLREHLDAVDAQLHETKPLPSPQPSPSEDKW